MEGQSPTGQGCHKQVREDSPRVGSFTISVPDRMQQWILTGQVGAGLGVWGMRQQ